MFIMNNLRHELEQTSAECESDEKLAFRMLRFKHELAKNKGDITLKKIAYIHKDSPWQC